jgi:hypothetical protein
LRPRGRKTRLQGGNGQYGPRKTPANTRNGRYVRISTRTAAILSVMGVKARLKAIPLDFKRLARAIGCSPRSVNDQVRRFGKVCPWAVQARNFEVFCRPPGPGSPWPRYFVISRHASHRIGKGARPCLRAKDPRAWREHRAHMRRLAFGIFLRGKKSAECKHKTLPLGEPSSEALARPPPGKTNRAAWRRVRKTAYAVVSSHLFNGPRVKIPRHRLAGFVANRLIEEHSFEQILAALRHADGLALLSGPYRAKDAPAWVCGVAARHLDRDGLAPQQRRRLRAAKFRKAAFKEADDEKPEVTPESIEIAARYAKRLKPSWEK